MIILPNIEVALGKASCAPNSALDPEPRFKNTEERDVGKPHL